MNDSTMRQPISDDAGGAQSAPAYDLDEIVAILTPERLTNYFQRVGAGNNAAAIDLYCWNHDVGGAFNVSLQQFEICLRNRIVVALRDKFSSEWFKNPRLVYYNADVTAAISKAVSKARENRHGFDPGEPDVIAASSLALWRELCKPEYAGLFWAKRLEMAFPLKPMKNDLRENLRDIHGPIMRLSKLRNRLAHHEHVLGSRAEKIGEMLTKRHQDMVQLITWMSSDFLAWLKERDRLADLIVMCPVHQAHST